MAGPLKTYAPTTDWDPDVQSYLEACLGVERLGRISEALTRPPLATCIRVNTLRTTAQVGSLHMFVLCVVLLGKQAAR